MRLKLGFVIGAVVLATVGTGPTASGQSQDKFMWVCHATQGRSGFVLLAVGVAAAERHFIEHGDEVTEYDYTSPPSCPMLE
jgi:hypothetical protein